MNSLILLAGYGVAVATLAPRLLIPQSISSWSPGLAIFAWFLASFTSVGCLLTAAVWAARPMHVSVRLLAAVGIASLAARLAWAAIRTIRAAITRRAAHRDGVTVVAEPDPALGVLVMTADEPMVYCLPGRPPQVVITTGAKALLTSEQLQAVLTHERSHLTERHDVLLGIAFALSRALPWLSLFRQTGPQVARLIEARADDAAARIHGRTAVATALLAMSDSPAGGPTVEVSQIAPNVLARALRLVRTSATGLRAMQLATITGLAAGPWMPWLLSDLALAW